MGIKRDTMLNTSKYGRRIRKLANNALKNKIKKYECPKCGKEKVVRISFGVWQCKSCGATFTGGAYTLTTSTGDIVKRVISSQSTV